MARAACCSACSRRPMRTCRCRMRRSPRACTSRRAGRCAAAPGRCCKQRHGVWHALVSCSGYGIYVCVDALVHEADLQHLLVLALLVDGVLAQGGLSFAKAALTAPRIGGAYCQ